MSGTFEQTASSSALHAIQNQNLDYRRARCAPKEEPRICTPPYTSTGTNFFLTNQGQSFYRRRICERCEKGFLNEKEGIPISITHHLLSKGPDNKIPADLDQEAAKKYADRRINEQLGKYGIETLRLNARELDTSKAGARKKLQEVAARMIEEERTRGINTSITF